MKGTGGEGSGIENSGERGRERKCGTLGRGRGLEKGYWERERRGREEGREKDERERGWEGGGGVKLRMRSRQREGRRDKEGGMERKTWRKKK